MPQQIEFNQDSGSWEYMGEQLRYIPANALIYNHVDKYAYRPINEFIAERTPYTFEDARWSNPIANMMVAAFGQRLNPFSFATAETAREMLALVTSMVAKLSGAYVVELTQNKISGIFQRTAERHIRITNTASGAFEDYSAGQIAANVINRGVEHAMNSLRYEIKLIN